MVATETEEKGVVAEALVEVCIERGNFTAAQEAAVLRGRPLTKIEIDALMGICIKKRWMYGAQKAAELGGRNLTPEEINSLVVAYCQEGQIEEAQGAAELGKRTLTGAEIDSLVRACIAKGKERGDALKAAQLGASKGVIDSLVGAYIEKGCFREAKEAVKLVGRNLTPEETSDIMRRYLEYGWFRSARDLAKLRGRPLSTEEIDCLIRACCSRGSRQASHHFVEALEAAQQGAPEEAINSFVEACAKKGVIDYAQKVAELRGKPLTRKEIDSLVRACIKEGRIYEYSLKKDAFRAARLGASKRAINSLVGAYIRKGWIGKAREAAELAGRELTTEEITRFRKVVLKK